MWKLEEDEARIEEEVLDRKKYQQLISEYEAFKRHHVKHFRFCPNASGLEPTYGEVKECARTHVAGLRISYRVSIETRDLETFQSIEEYRLSNLQYRVLSILKKSGVVPERLLCILG